MPFNAAPAAHWFGLARRILSHAGVTGITDLQLAAVITPCNGSARQVTDSVVQLALQVRRAKSTQPASVDQHDTSNSNPPAGGFFVDLLKVLHHHQGLGESAQDEGEHGLTC